MNINHIQQIWIHETKLKIELSFNPVIWSTYFPYWISKCLVVDWAVLSVYVLKSTYYDICIPQVNFDPCDVRCTVYFEIVFKTFCHIVPNRINSFYDQLPWCQTPTPTTPRLFSCHRTSTFFHLDLNTIIQYIIFYIIWFFELFFRNLSVRFNF